MRIPKLIVAVANFALFLTYIQETPTGQYEFSGMYGKYIELLLEAWKGEYELLFTEDFDFGSKDSSGNWTGQIGAVSRGEADIAISHMSASQARSEVVDFSTVYTMEAITFAAHKWTEDDIFQFLSLFDKTIWFLIFISLISLSALFFLMLEGKNNYSFVLLSTFANAIGKSLDLHRDILKWKLLLGGWFLCTFIISCSYSAVLLSFLTLPPKTNILKDFRELSEAVQKGTHRAYSSKGTLMVPFLVTSKEKYLQRLGNAIIKNNWYTDFDSIFSEEQDPKNVFIMSRSQLNFFYGTGTLKESYYISSDNLIVLPVSIAMNKNFCCGSRINKIVTRIASSGLEEKFYKDVSLRYWLDIFSKFVKPKDEDIRALSMRDLRGAFAILSIGLGCSLLVFLAEIAHGRLYCSRKGSDFCSEINHLYQRGKRRKIALS